jgi:hypothetical protein
LTLSSAVEHRHSFLDYISHGLNVGFELVIDFTQSNGIPTDPTSLHYQHIPEPELSEQLAKFGISRVSEYTRVFISLYKLVMGYDSDGYIPLRGFGGAFPTLHNPLVKLLSHNFAVNGDETNPLVHGINGVVDTYTHRLSNIDLSGPTYFAPVITQIVNDKKEELSKGDNEFKVVVLITDGQNHDMMETIDILVEASSLPIAFLIIGVGNGNFDNMVRLDADNSVLINSRGKKAVRDNVQFVKYNDYKNSEINFLKECLEEVPDQLVDSMKILGKKPSDFGPHNTLTNQVRLELPPSYTESCSQLVISEQ